MIESSTGISQVRIIPFELWDEFEPLSNRQCASDMDGDLAYLIRGQSKFQIQSLEVIEIQFLVNGEWWTAPFSPESVFPSLNWEVAPCWYWPFFQDRFTYFARRALVPKDWVYRD